MKLNHRLDRYTSRLDRYTSRLFIDMIANQMRVGKVVSKWQDNGANARRRIAEQHSQAGDCPPAASLRLQILNTNTRFAKHGCSKNKEFFSSSVDYNKSTKKLSTRMHLPPRTPHSSLRLPDFGTPELSNKTPVRESAFLYVRPATFESKNAESLAHNFFKILFQV